MAIYQPSFWDYLAGGIEQGKQSFDKRKNEQREQARYDDQRAREEAAQAVSILGPLWQQGTITPAQQTAYEQAIKRATGQEVKLGESPGQEKKRLAGMVDSVPETTFRMPGGAATVKLSGKELLNDRQRKVVDLPTREEEADAAIKRAATQTNIAATQENIKSEQASRQQELYNYAVKIADTTVAGAVESAGRGLGGRMNLASIDAVAAGTALADDLLSKDQSFRNLTEEQRQTVRKAFSASAVRAKLDMLMQQAQRSNLYEQPYGRGGSTLTPQQRLSSAIDKTIDNLRQQAKLDLGGLGMVDKNLDGGAQVQAKYNPMIAQAMMAKNLADQGKLAEAQILLTELNKEMIASMKGPRAQAQDTPVGRRAAAYNQYLKP